MSQTSEEYPLFISTSEIKPGGSAILSGNKFVFYSSHYLAILIISISLISCVVVIIKILLNYKSTLNGNGRRQQIDFSLRFPLYLALADLFWGLSHLMDHMYLILTETYPEDITTSTALSINLWFFLGYQQLMHGSLAAYMYLRVVHLNTLNLGAGEWRLHLFCFSFMGLSVILFYFIGAFGCSGYWFLENRNSTSGLILSFTVAIVCTANALCTTVGYHLISKKVNEQKETLRNRNRILLDSNMANKGYHSTATKCLTTFVRNAACLYCPLAVLAWAVTIQTAFGVIEPLTTLAIVIVSNSCGWANAWGFFYNDKLKKIRLDLISPVLKLELGLSSNNSNSHSVTDTSLVVSFS